MFFLEKIIFFEFVNQDMKKIINQLRRELRRNSDLSVKISSQRFFKEKIKVYGVPASVVAKISKTFNREILALDKKTVFALSEELWRSGYLEEAIIACQWSYLIRKKYQPADFKIFEKWVNRYVTNWATCDTLGNHTTGTFIEMYPDYLKELPRWAKSNNRWVRRSAAVTLILPARRGKFLKEIFTLSDILLLDKDDLVQKAYGWLLKVASEAHRSEVFSYVMRNKDKMPRTALRYAIEKMPPSLKTKAMKK